MLPQTSSTFSHLTATPASTTTVSAGDPCVPNPCDNGGTRAPGAGSQGITLDESGSSAQAVPVSGSPTVPLGEGAIAGIVIGSVVGVALVAAVVTLTVRRGKWKGAGSARAMRSKRGEDFDMVE